MCKVYNSIGCLTAIKSHLREHHLNEFKSVNELISFQKSYSTARQQIISHHSFLIEQERNTLREEIQQLTACIVNKKDDLKKPLQSEFEKLKHRLNYLPPVYPNNFQPLIHHLKKAGIKTRIWYSQLTSKFKIWYAARQHITAFNEKNNRYQYLLSHFEEAVNKSSLLQVRELERKKNIIDELSSTILGALGEQKVVREIEQLSDDYILINDFTCAFDRPIYNRQENDYIKSIQIDHLLVSPAGIFIIETKNWSERSLNNLSLRSPVEQIKRTNFALFRILAGGNTHFTLRKHHWGTRKIPLRNLIVLINHKPREEFQHVKVLTLNELLGYIEYFNRSFSYEEIQSIANYLLKLCGRVI